MGRHQRHIRHRFRPADSRQRRPNRQSFAPLVRPSVHAVSNRLVQRRRLCRGGARPGGGEESLARAVPGRFDAAGPGTSPQATIFFRQCQSAGHFADPPKGRTLARLTSRCRRDSIERHAPRGGDRGADAAARRRARSILGRELENHARRIFLYQSHVAAGSARDLAGGDVRASVAAAFGNHIFDQSRSAEGGQGVLSGGGRQGAGIVAHRRRRQIAAYECRISPSPAATGSTELAQLHSDPHAAASCFTILRKCIPSGSSM